MYALNYMDIMLDKSLKYGLLFGIRQYVCFILYLFPVSTFHGDIIGNLAKAETFGQTTFYM